VTLSAPARRTAPTRRTALTLLGAAGLATTAAACSDPTGATSAGTGSPGGSPTAPTGAGATSAYDTSPEQDRVRSEADPALTAALPADVAAAGVLRVAVMAAGGAPPLVFAADDNRTPIGSEVDVAQLVADKLGLELETVVLSWDAWPLKLESGEVHTVAINIGITEERLQKYDFASNRAAYVGFGVKAGSGLTIQEPQDIEGLTVSAGGGTTQETILLRWNEILASEGRTPATIQYYANDADTLLALGAGRLDAYAGPNPGVVYTVATRDDVELAGTVAEAWPEDTLIGLPSVAGTGLADPVAAALAALIAEGTYDAALAKWGLADEALTESLVFTAGEPEGRAPSL
jgi:polar amino acid transport system substrate-binding protein